MKKKLIAFLISAAILSAFASGACNNKSNPKWYDLYYSAMKTSATLRIRCDGTRESKSDLDFLGVEVWNVLDNLENSLSVSVKTSSIYKFNRADAGEEIEIDKTAYEVLTLAKNIYTMTDRYYNPAVYYNVQAFRFDGDKNYPQTGAELPEDEDIEKYNRLSAHFNEIELKEDNGKYYAVKPDITVEIDGKPCSMKIDLGGIGKGYAVDKVDALIDRYGFKYGYFNFGYSSLSFKTFSETEQIKMYLTDARGKGGKYYSTVLVSDVCVSTSGDYEQYYEIDGTRFCHIINPVTGKPVQTEIMTATVIGGSAAEDDALTTALMAMGKEKAVKFINEKLSDRRVIMSLDLGESKYGIITNMPAGGYVVDDNNFTVLNTVADGKIVLGE